MFHKEFWVYGLGGQGLRGGGFRARIRGCKTSLLACATGSPKCATPEPNRPQMISTGTPRNNKLLLKLPNKHKYASGIDHTTILQYGVHICIYLHIYKFCVYTYVCT